MKLLRRLKDGGPNSPVDAFFLVEFKRLFSVALLRFNKGGRETYHTHAFNAWTWFLIGDLVEEEYGGDSFHRYKRSLKPKFTPRRMNHRVYANETSWCLTLRGPWSKLWYETDDKGKTCVFGWGRRVIYKDKDFGVQYDKQ